MARSLTLDETKKYLIAFRELKDKDALMLLTVCNSGLIGYFAKRFLGKGLSYDELVSAGNEALIRAINKFDYLSNDIGMFSSYVAISIENQMKQELRKYNKHSHVLSFEQPIYYSKDGDEITIEDLIATDGEELLENMIADIKIDIVKEVLKCLNIREKQIILLRYGFYNNQRKTQQEIAQIFGCSKQAISKQEQKALLKMRHNKNIEDLKDFIR